MRQLKILPSLRTWQAAWAGSALRTRVGEISYRRGRVACGSSHPIEAEGSLSVVGR